MNPIRKLLSDADPLRTEPMPSDEQRDSRRRAILASAPESRRGRVSFSRLAFLTSLTIGLLVVVSQFSSIVTTRTYAAVRFEVRLAEETPAPGLREAKIVGSNRSIYLYDEVVISNSDIDRAELIETGSPARFSIGVRFTDSGTQKIGIATTNHIGRPMAILIDGDVVMAPTVRSAIGNSAVINGDYSREQAVAIVNGIGL